MRQIILDTETTGLSTADGHRIIEIGAVEMINRKLTGNDFHRYIHPERDIDPGAQNIHGITLKFLADKPKFSQIAEEFLAFIKDAELIIHNAVFDIGFIDYELKLLEPIISIKSIKNTCKITDTLLLARNLHPGQKNSLDALCKRYHVDNTKRDLHGALLDANLLAHVYLAMTGGQGSLFDNMPDIFSVSSSLEKLEKIKANHKTSIPPIIIKATPEELRLHEARLKEIEKIAQ